MSGDVQPRKRKDKKKKKDEPTAEELRGTAAAFGEGDVLMHSQQDHGTGGHWCAKIIFFSLLAVLIGLIGLIILENRGLSELEANSVESQYTGILDGWIEDAPDDHHDEHTLELKHPDEEEHDEAEASDEAEQTELEDIEREPADEETATALSAERDADEGLSDAEDVRDRVHEEVAGESDEEAADPRTDDDDDDDNDEGDDDFLQQDDDDEDRDESDHDDEDDEPDDTDRGEQDHFSAAVSSEAPYEEVEESEEKLPGDSLLEEEEYEREQERQRQEEAAASHLWLKLVVGAALLLATHAVVRRATRHAGSDDEEGEAAEEEAPPPDRRMTLLPHELAPTEVKKSVAFEAPKSGPRMREPSPPPAAPPAADSEDEAEGAEEAEEAEEVEEKTVARKDATASRGTPEREPPGDEDAGVEAAAEEGVSDGETPDDMEMVEGEDEEEDDEELGEEEISDVDDGELLSRLEAKYGRLPEPERYERPPRKDGGATSMLPEDEWPEEPHEERWRRELDLAEEEMHRGSARAALARCGAPELLASPRARWLSARALDALAEERKDNALLTRAAAAYLELLHRPELLSDGRLLSVAERAIDRMRFKGTPLAAAPAHRALTQRFPDRPEYRNQLVISYLMANRVELASEELQEILKRWPDDRVALAHYGFVLKTQQERLEEAVGYLRRALDDDGAGGGGADEPRFHYHLGDALLALGRPEEARAVHERAARRGHFRSAAQRSLYNVDRLTARPWWDVEATPYKALAQALEMSWREILAEGEAARALYAAEREGLRERGAWSQLELFARGRELPGRCARAPVACRAVRAEPAAAGCRRGQVKFSLLEPGTHVRAHVGPTNCRLRMHLGLSNTTGAYIRVHNETREWREGHVLIFDDSFEHEVWHNGTGARLVLIVDVWHPELSTHERAKLPAI